MYMYIDTHYYYNVLDRVPNIVQVDIVHVQVEYLNIVQVQYLNIVQVEYLHVQALLISGRKVNIFA